MIQPWAKSTLIIAVLVLTGCVIRIERPASPSVEARKQGAPRLMLNSEGLDDYGRYKLFASRQIEEGDYVSALEDLEKARSIRQDDPALYELLALAYDGDRQSGPAYENFLRAGEMYLRAGGRESAWRMLSWLRSFKQYADDPRAGELEAELRAPQETGRASGIK